MNAESVPVSGSNIWPSATSNSPGAGSANGSMKGCADGNNPELESEEINSKLGAGVVPGGSVPARMASRSSASNCVSVRLLRNVRFWTMNGASPGNRVRSGSLVTIYCGSNFAVPPEILNWPPTMGVLTPEPPSPSLYNPFLAINGAGAPPHRPCVRGARRAGTRPEHGCERGACPPLLAAVQGIRR